MPNTGRFTEPSEAKLIERLQELPNWANRDKNLVYRGRFVSLDFQLVVGTQRCYVSIESGEVKKIEVGPQRMRPSTFVISASVTAWENFWQPMPAPWWHDLFAMNKKGNATIEGNLHPFIANLQYFKDLLAIPRRITGAG